MKRVDDSDVHRFRDLTQDALIEPDANAFIETLFTREKISGRIAEFAPVLDGVTAEALYADEMRVIERLEAERSKLFAEIETYARNVKAMKSYRPHFPLPPAHPFFWKKD